MQHPSVRSRQGGALVAAMIAVMILGGLCTAALGMALASMEEVDRRVAKTRAFYAAEAAISDFLARIQGSEEGSDLPQLGSQEAQVPLGSACYFATARKVGDHIELLATGTSGEATAQIEVWIAATPGPLGESPALELELDRRILEGSLELLKAPGFEIRSWRQLPTGSGPVAAQ